MFRSETVPELHQPMNVIRAPLIEWNKMLPVVRIPVERLTLAKRRWRGVAEDGCEFGFDLETPLNDAAVVLQTDTTVYAIAQRFEPVLEVGLVADTAKAARLGWTIGNLHFPIEVAETIVRVRDDPALRQLFDRERIQYVACKRVFHPLSGAHHH